MARLATSLLLALGCSLCELHGGLCARVSVKETSTLSEQPKGADKTKGEKKTPKADGEEKASREKKGTGKKGDEKKAGKKKNAPVAEEYEAGAWDIGLSEWTKDQGCFATALAGLDGAWFAAAPVETKDEKQISEGWQYFLTGDHDEAITQDDGTIKKVTINEPSALTAVLHDRQAPNGLWVKGAKYSVMNHEPNYGGSSMTWVMGLSKPTSHKPSVEASGTGVQIIRTDQYILAGLFDQASRQGGNCLTSLKAYAEQLG